MSKGYVIKMVMTASSDNAKFAGETNVEYCGKNDRTVGQYGFEPYATETGAKQGLPYWKSYANRISRLDEHWIYTIEGIVPYADSMQEESFVQYLDVMSRVGNIGELDDEVKV